MATFFVNSTSGELMAARIAARAGANPFAIDGCGPNCSFLYEAPETKKVGRQRSILGRSYSCDRRSELNI